MGSFAIIPEASLFGQQQVQQKRRRQKPTRDADTIIRNLTDLSEGDPVVHEEHGVGRYQGMEMISCWWRRTRIHFANLFQRRQIICPCCFSASN